MHLFISAGEPSGDLHGANLVRSLKKFDPSIRTSGFGGERMQAAGCKLLFQLTSLAVMWFLHVIRNIFKFISLLNQAERFLKEEKPDAVVVIDYPGFHWNLAKRAHKLGIPVYYFVPPQLWAWAPWRIKKMRKYVRHVLSALPFEDKWYRDRGMKSDYIGHPYFDELAARQVDTSFVAEQKDRGGRIVAILPGSRMQEVTKNLPDMLDAAERIYKQKPDARFLIASFNDAQAAVARELVANRQLPAEVCVKRTPEIIESAEACISVSGSVSLELMFALKPATIVYRLGWFSLRMGKLFKLCKYITLVNLLADREIYPEFLTDRNEAEQMAAKVLKWLEDPAAANEVRRALSEVRERVAQPGACERAAKFIVDDLRKAGAPPQRAAA